MGETGISPDDDDDDEDDMLFVRWYRDLNIDFDTTVAGPSLHRLRQYCHESISNLSSSSFGYHQSPFIIRFSSDKNKSVLSTTDTIFSSSPSLRFQHHQLKRRRTLRISSNTAGDIINVPLPLGCNDNVVLLQTKKKRLLDVDR